MNGIPPERWAQNERREAWLLGLAFVFLCLAAVGLNLAPAARTGDWSAAGGRWAALAVIPLWAGCAWLARRELRRRVPGRDPFLLPVCMLLSGWGLLVVWRLTPEFGTRQTAWFVLGVMALLLILRAPHDLRWLRHYRFLWLTAGLLLTALTLLLGTSPSGSPPRLWLGWGAFYFQPSEVLRLMLVVYLASYFGERLTLGWGKVRRDLLPTLAPLLVIWGLSVALLAVQRDLGTGSLVLALLAVLLYLATGRWQVLLAAGVLAVLGGSLSYSLAEVVRVRVQAWLNPWVDPIAGSYQQVQSLIALASGAVFGRGPGLGSPGFVPAAHTDFIFAALVEEWGLIGGLAAIALFAILVARGLRVAARNQDPFAVLLAAGLSAAIGLQAVLIIGGVIRLLPLTGVTLPFVSYGGSSLVTSFAALGLLLVLSGRGRGVGGFGLPLHRLQLGMSAAWLALAVTLGWWTIYRVPTLVNRTDNPRRALASLYSRRGSILDRHGEVLAFSTGDRGDYKRVYPGQEAEPVVGYDSLRYGEAGIEESMDDWLRGMAGYSPWTILWQNLLTGAPPPGLDVVLTMDAGAQRIAGEALSGRRGAVVALDPATGEILVLASAPSYDANHLEEDWASLVSRGDAPLLQRATQGQYQPGTALGPLILAWAEARQDTAVLDDVGDPSAPLLVHGTSFGCAGNAFQGQWHDPLQALRDGCPAPILALGEALGGSEMAQLIDAFGLVEPPSVRLPSAPTGELPEALQGEELRLEVLGQGGMTVTPLSLARALAALWNEGQLPALRLVDAVRLADDTWQKVAPLDPQQPAISAEAAQNVIAKLEAAGGKQDFAAMALSGASGQRLAWYLGVINRPDGAVLVVVIVLEGEVPASAQRIGSLMRQALDGAGGG